MRTTTWMLAATIGMISTAATAADGAASAAGNDQVAWARWQGRLSLGSSVPGWQLGVDPRAPRLSSATLMGDYYFGSALIAPLGGFRATSGLILGPRRVLSTGQPGLAAGNALSIGSRLFGQAPPANPNDAIGDTTTLPYLGVGYTGLSARNGWSFSADLGLVALSPGSARLGRVFGGNGQGLDDVVRDMRMAPLLQLGVSYAF